MSSVKRRSSVTLFLASVGVAASGIGFHAESLAAADPLLSEQSAQWMAQATQECVPIGEGENCSGRRRRRGPSLLPQENNSGATPNNPAADTSSPTPNPGAQSGTAAEELNQIERGDL